MIKTDYKSPKPLHEQISEGLKQLIVSGVLKPDEQMPSVRELSVSLTVNPNTVQRAYRDLESEEFIYSVRGKGNFVAARTEVNKEKVSELYGELGRILEELAYYGEGKEQILAEVENKFRERDE